MNGTSLSKRISVKKIISSDKVKGVSTETLFLIVNVLHESLASVG